jgi:LDH2 family malate/lactate/ureidoglycolate dehydrogenase
MVTKEHWYAIEKFSTAIYILATGAGDIRYRLRDAFLGPLLMINSEHLPRNLQEDFIWIERNVTKYKEKWPGQLEKLRNYEKEFPDFKEKHPEFYPNSIEATCRRIRRRTGVEIARRIFKIYDSLNSQSK